MVTMLVFFQKS